MYDPYNSMYLLLVESLSIYIENKKLALVIIIRVAIVSSSSAGYLNADIFFRLAWAFHLIHQDENLLCILSSSILMHSCTYLCKLT